MSDATFPHALPAGYALHWYVVRSVLGQGGFGITYLGEDTNLHQKVAIKEFLPAELATRRGNKTVHPLTANHTDTYGWGLSRFLDEARTLARFRHPSVVRVLSVFEANNTAYMVMEFEEGRSLEDALKFRAVESEADLRRITLSLLDGLSLVHEAGFIHRDIKPQNIYLRADGSPVLLDFGSARQAVGAETRTLTALVSPGYAPYEQYDSSREGDGKQGPWTDIYAMGATLYRAVTGHGPPDAMARVNGVMSGKDVLVPAREAGAGRFSTGFLAAIDKALAFRPQDRPQCIAEWRAMLEGESAPGAAAAGPAPAASGGPATAWPEPDAGAAPTEPPPAGDDGEEEEAATVVAVPRVAADAGPTPAPGSTGGGHGRRGPLIAGVIVLAAAAGLGAWLLSGPPPAQAPPGADQLAEERARAALEQRRQAQADRAKAAGEARRQAEAVQAKAAEEARRQAEEAQARAVEEARRQAEAEQAKAAEEARRQAETEQARAAEEARRQAEAEQAARVEKLLADAGQDLSALRLTSPPGDNAVERLRAALALDPGNARASEGLQRVVDRYVELAGQASDSGELDRAAQYLDRADTVVPATAVVAQARTALAQRRAESEKAAADKAAAAREVEDKARQEVERLRAEKERLERELAGTRAAPAAVPPAAATTAGPKRVGFLPALAHIRGQTMIRGTGKYFGLAQKFKVMANLDPHYRVDYSYYEPGDESRIQDADALWHEAQFGSSRPDTDAVRKAGAALGIDVAAMMSLQRLQRRSISEDFDFELFLVDVATGRVLSARGNQDDVKRKIRDLLAQMVPAD